MFKKTLLKTLLILTVFTNAYGILAGATEWLPADITNGHVIIDVEIDGFNAKALLDTGASINLINSKFIEKNSIKHTKGGDVVIRGLYGEEETYFANNINITFQGMKLNIDNSIVQQLDDIDLIFGLPFFHAFIVQIDYPNQKYKLINYGDLDLRKFKNVDLYHDQTKSALVTRVEIDNQHKLKLLLDTGNPGGIIINRSVAESKGWLDKYAVGKEKSSGIIKESIDTDLLVLPSVKFGPFSLTDVIANVPEKNNSKYIRQISKTHDTGSNLNRGKKYHGILGYDILKHFVITIDAKTARAHIHLP